jgi:hypothetical protein
VTARRIFTGKYQYWDSLQVGVYQRFGRERHLGDANWIVAGIISLPQTSEYYGSATKLRVPHPSQKARRMGHPKN